MVTPSGEAAQTPASATSNRGLGREAQAALLRVRTRPKCPEGNLRELSNAPSADLLAQCLSIIGDVGAEVDPCPCWAGEEARTQLFPLFTQGHQERVNQ